MTEYPSLESISCKQFQQILDKLKLLLEDLPTALPSLGTSSAYLLFNDYQPDTDLMEKTGCEVSTLSEQLKDIFGWNVRTTGDGIVSIGEQGPSPCAETSQ
jgi:hypothetical protein